MAGKKAKLNCTLTSTTTTKTTDTSAKKTGLNFCHTNTGLPKKCIKDRADTVPKSSQFLRFNYLSKIEVSLRSWTPSRTGIAYTHCQNKLS